MRADVCSQHIHAQSGAQDFAVDGDSWGGEFFEIDDCWRQTPRWGDRGNGWRRRRLVKTKTTGGHGDGDGRRQIRPRQTATSITKYRWRQQSRQRRKTASCQFVCWMLPWSGFMLGAKNKFLRIVVVIKFGLGCGFICIRFTLRVH